MTEEVITVRPDTSVGDIVALLLEHKISAVPVIDDDGHVVGIVREGDLLGQPPPAARARCGCGSSTKVQSASKGSQQPAI